jgi:hypothetical protein
VTQLAFRDRKGNVIASAVAGGILLIFLIVVTFLLPDATTFQRGVIRFCIALAAGFSATFFVGGVVLQGQIFGNQIGAGGGFVLFILVQFFVNPWDTQAVAADEMPSAVRTSEAIAQAQDHLKGTGGYRGAVDGKAGRATRKAIQSFQEAHGLTPTGFLNPPTVDALWKLSNGSARPAATDRPVQETPGEAEQGLSKGGDEHESAQAPPSIGRTEPAPAYGSTDADSTSLSAAGTSTPMKRSYVWVRACWVACTSSRSCQPAIAPQQGCDNLRGPQEGELELRYRYRDRPFGIRADSSHKVEDQLKKFPPDACGLGDADCLQRRQDEQGAGKSSDRPGSTGRGAPCALWLPCGEVLVPNAAWNIQLKDTTFRGLLRLSIVRSPTGEAWDGRDLAVIAGRISVPGGLLKAGTLFSYRLLKADGTEVASGEFSSVATSVASEVRRTVQKDDSARLDAWLLVLTSDELDWNVLQLMASGGVEFP